MAAQADSWALPYPSSGQSSETSYFVLGVGFWLALIQVSIAASEIVLAALVVAWVVLAARGSATFASLPINRPIALYAGASLLSAVFSFEPAMSLQASKKLLLLVVPYMLVSTVRRAQSVEALVLVLVVVADIGALVGLWQYRFGELGGIDARIHGFMSHYMTYSGLLMGVAALALAQVLFGSRWRGFFSASLALISLALLLTLTRSAWIGMLAAGALLAYLRNWKLLLIAPALALVLWVALPRSVERRLESFWRLDTSGWDRLYMIDAGASMVARHPWLGVGPNLVNEIYPIYRSPDAPDRQNPHLHNNLMQIAAERGLLCLFAWLWILAWAGLASFRAFVSSRHRPTEHALIAGGIGVLCSGFVAGLFEYNFGDSEFQMLFLFAMSIPWMLSPNPSDVGKEGAR